MGDEGEAEAAGTGTVPGMLGRGTGTEAAFCLGGCALLGIRRLTQFSVSVFGIVMKAKAAFSAAAPKQTRGAARREGALPRTPLWGYTRPACTHTHGRTGF